MKDPRSEETGNEEKEGGYEGDRVKKDKGKIDEDKDKNQDSRPIR